MTNYKFNVFLWFICSFVFCAIADDECNLAPVPVKPRLNSVSYPSVFSAWGGIGWSSVLNQADKPDIDQIAQHDLWLNKPRFGLRFTPPNNHDSITLVGNITEAKQKRSAFITRNPNMVFIIEIRMRTHPLSMFPENSPFWIRDDNGNRTDEGLTDFTHPGLQDIIVQKAIAVAKCGLYDGVFFDWWFDQGVVLADRTTGWLHGYRGIEAERHARKVILTRIRNATRSDFLIMVNNNRRTLPFSAPYINGTYMETLIPRERQGNDLDKALREVETTLLWSSHNLRRPHINAAEGWGIPHLAPDDPRNVQWMRVFTCLALTHSDAYTLFIANYNKKHYWYDFWDADLGRPVGEKGQLYQETEGLYIREFTNGWAVYNHSGESQVITLPEEAQGVASGRRNTEHALPNLDGEMYLRAAPKNPADVNGDGVVNIFDLTLVAQALSTGNGQGDVNGDGVVNVFDLVFVAGEIQ